MHPTICIGMCHVMYFAVRACPQTFISDVRIGQDGAAAANVNVKAKNGKFRVVKLAVGTEKKIVGEFALADAAPDTDLSFKCVTCLCWVCSGCACFLQFLVVKLRAAGVQPVPTLTIAVTCLQVHGWLPCFRRQDQCLSGRDLQGW